MYIKLCNTIWFSFGPVLPFHHIPYWQSPYQSSTINCENVTKRYLIFRNKNALIFSWLSLGWIPVPHCHETCIKRCIMFVRIFWSRSQVCPRMPNYSNAHAELNKWIFEVQFPGNWFEFDIIVGVENKVEKFNWVLIYDA